MGETTTKAAFFEEVLAYRPMLIRAVENILGQRETREVFLRLRDLEAAGGYIGDPEILHQIGAFLTGERDDLGFYVITLLDKDTALTVRESGLITPLGLRIETRPIFLFWDEAIERSAGRVASLALEQRYFLPWLHEFGHFLCYFLQERPLAAGIAILCSALRERGYAIQALRELEATQGEGTRETIKGMGRALAKLGALNEAMAVWWEGELTKEMGLDAGKLLEAKKADNPLVNRLAAQGREECLEHIRHWDRAAYHPDPFAKNFAGSLMNMKMERWGFLGGSSTGQGSGGGSRNEKTGVGSRGSGIRKHLDD